MTPRVAAVIGNYDGADHLPECLDSLGSQTPALSEVVVVDADSRDDSVAVATRHGARVLESENRGLGFLYNQGIDAVDADFVLLANNDLAFEPDCVRLLAEALLEDGDRFVADPTQLGWNGDRVIHARTLLRRGSLLRTPIPGLVIDPTVRAEAVTTTVCANAGAMLVRRSMFLELGGFDETFFLDFEDLDLCWRAWLRGWSSVYVPSARLRHKVGMSASPAVSPRRLRASHHNLLRFALKCLPTTSAITVVVGELVRLARAPRPVAGGLAQVARELPEIAAQRRGTRGRGDVLARLLELR